MSEGCLIYIVGSSNKAGHLYRAHYAEDGAVLALDWKVLPYSDEP